MRARTTERTLSPSSRAAEASNVGRSGSCGGRASPARQEATTRLSNSKASTKSCTGKDLEHIGSILTKGKTKWGPDTIRNQETTAAMHTKTEETGHQNEKKKK